MKSLVSASQPVGGDGAMASESLSLDDAGNIVADVQLKYPVAKLLKPVTDELEVIKQKIEAAIPGDWDKAILDPIFAGLEQTLINKLSGQ